jgi:Mn2+/Fe2+ NRAMP family transporter
LFIYTYQEDGMNSEGNTTVKKRWWILLLAAIGPGLTVMLADTDVGSIITAAQSGVRWGYKLLALQVVLIPILYFVQELTTRIGITTAQGHAGLIRDVFGKKWAWISVVTLFIASIGALVTEFAGIEGVGMLFGVSKWITVPLCVAVLIAISRTGKYKRVESIAIIVGLFELIFIPAAIFAKPDIKGILSSFSFAQPFGDHSYWVLIAANVGAVIMPWMLFYQQGAVIDKGLSRESIKYSRIDTFIGSIVTQVIMSAVLILAAATIGKTNPNSSLLNVQQAADALTPLFGSLMGKIIFAVGLTGAALIASIVVSLAMSWAFGEVLKVSCSLNCEWKDAPVFYGFFAGGMIIAAALVLIGIPLIPLTIAVEVLNCLLLPIVLGFLLALAWKVIPEPYKLKLWEKIILIAIYILVCSLGLYTIFHLN